MSIIIPVYNAEKYIEETIESIICQTYKSWELILVDNMSSDRSMEICRKYEKRYTNVYVYKESKAGCAFARNRGIKEATGEYIIFVDADDYLKGEQIVEKWIYALEKEKADIVVGNYERLWKKKVLPAASHSSFSKESRESEEFRFQGFFTTGTLSYVWGKAYRASFLKENRILFQNLDYAEDKMFNIECYIKNARYAFINEIGYVYRRNEESISYKYKPDSCKCWMQIADRTEREVRKSKRKEYLDIVRYIIVFAAFFDAKMEYVEKEKSLNATIQLLKRYKKDNLAKVCFKDLAHGKQMKNIHSKMWKIMLRGFSFVMNMNMYLILAIGIKLLIDLRIDERLSDTGLRE